MSSNCCLNARIQYQRHVFYLATGTFKLHALCNTLLICPEVLAYSVAIAIRSGYFNAFCRSTRISDSIKEKFFVLNAIAMQFSIHLFLVSLLLGKYRTILYTAKSVKSISSVVFGNQAFLKHLLLVVKWANQLLRRAAHLANSVSR